MSDTSGSKFLSGPARRYLHAVRHELCLRGRTRSRAVKDLTARLRELSGNSYDEIINQLGTTGDISYRLNHSVPGWAYSKSYWRFAFLPFAFIGIFESLHRIGTGLLCFILMEIPDFFYAVSPESAASIGIIGGADGPTAIFLTSTFSRSSLSLAIYVLMAVIGAGGYYLLRHIRQPI